jgi:hypothetical protein
VEHRVLRVTLELRERLDQERREQQDLKVTPDYKEPKDLKVTRELRE